MCRDVTRVTFGCTHHDRRRDPVAALILGRKQERAQFALGTHSLWYLPVGSFDTGLALSLELARSGGQRVGLSDQQKDSLQKHSIHLGHCILGQHTPLVAGHTVGK